MWKSFFVIISSFLLVELSSSLSQIDAENRITFTIFDDLGSPGKIWKFNQTFYDLCESLEMYKITFIVHGWRGSKSSWISQLKEKYLKYRGGCVVIVNWGFFAEDLDYMKVVEEFFPTLSDVLASRLQMLENEGFPMNQVILYGHSVGGHLCINAGLKLGYQKIGQIDTCDLAGPLFNIFEMNHDPKNAARNVQCIHTSIDAGTTSRKCHQDFLMGNCGMSQPASGDTLSLFIDSLAVGTIGRSLIPEPLKSSAKMSHEICNDFYVNSFEHDFIANNSVSCENSIDFEKLPKNFKMGFMEKRRNSSIIGIIPCPTSTNPPYNFVDLL